MGENSGGDREASARQPEEVSGTFSGAQEVPETIRMFPADRWTHPPTEVPGTSSAPLRSGTTHPGLALVAPSRRTIQLQGSMAQPGK